MFESYESLPMIVQAVQFTHENKNRLFCEMTGQVFATYEDDQPILKVTTLHGELAIVRIGDWIAEDASPGTYYPINDDVFRKKYVKCKSIT